MVVVRRGGVAVGDGVGDGGEITVVDRSASDDYSEQCIIALVKKWSVCNRDAHSLCDLTNIWLPGTPPPIT